MNERFIAELIEWRAEMLNMGCETTPLMEAAFARGVVSACAILLEHPDAVELATTATNEALRDGRGNK